MIKNAICYKFTGEKLELPEAIDAESLAHKPTASQISTIGLTKHEVTGQLVAPFKGGFCLTVQKWEKKIDNAALNACLSDSLGALEENVGRSATKKEKAQLKEDLVLELLPNVLPSPKLMHLYYLEDSNIIIADNAVASFCEDALALLRKIIGTLPVTLMTVDGVNFTDQVSEKLADDTKLLNNEFTIQDSLELNGDKCKVKFDGVDLLDDSTVEEIVGQINEGGMFVKSILLEHKLSCVKFNLVDECKLKNVTSVVEAEDCDDVIHEWQVTTLTSVVEIKTIITQLTDYFNG